MNWKSPFHAEPRQAAVTYNDGTTPGLSFGYDSLGREISVQDPLGNVNQTAYDPVTSRVTSRTDPHGQVTSYQYYPAGGTNAGMLKCMTGPTGKNTYYNYDGCGRTIQTWGDVPYPCQYSYDQYGGLTNLTTYRGGSQWTGSTWPSSPGTGDTTQWFYDPLTGLLTKKTDASGQSVLFTYYDNYLPQARIWARGAASTNIYSVTNLDLLCINYSDGTTVAFTNSTFPTLDRQGQPSVIMDASGTRLLTYDYAQRLISTYYNTGMLAGITVTNHINPVYGRDVLEVQGSSPALTNTFAYDLYGRLSGIGCGIYSAAYTYWPNSDLLCQTTSSSNATAVLTTTRVWDVGPRLLSIANTLANGSVSTADEYAYDALDRRVSALLEDGSHWRYGYDARNELTSAQRSWSDWTPVAGQQYAYAYDNIGNRTSSKFGGDANGLNLRQATYGANNLNEYTSVTNPGYQAILGLALATNTVAVTNTSTASGGLADRKGEYFHRELAMANSSGPAWQGVGVTSGGVTTNGGLAFPANNQALVYDQDGNLTFDGIWSYFWDCENRLTAMQMTNISGVADSNRLRLEFAYDNQNRRVSKTVKNWSSASQTFGSPVTSLFVYDNWNLIAALTTQWAVTQAFFWGKDLSGTIQGAGGIGGLLGVLQLSSGQASNCGFTCYDGAANITALISGNDQTLLARYEYSPFGELLRSTGPQAKANPIRSSTKFRDHETGLIYYGCRYYSPSQGRCVGRDSAGEEGGANLFGFCYNNSITGCDPFGKMVEDPLEAVAIGAGMEGTSGAMMNAIVGQAEAVADETFIAEATELDEGLAMQSKSFSVYQSVGADGQVNYVGMTSRFEERAAEQLLERQITIGKIPGLNNLSSADARAVEQTLIDSFKLGKNGGSLINKINSISSTSHPEYYINSILRGMDLLSKAGYGGF